VQIKLGVELMEKLLRTIKMQLRKVKQMFLLMNVHQVIWVANSLLTFLYISCYNFLKPNI
jgi:hypothetical protein